MWTLFGFKADSKGQPVDENKPICQLCQHTIAVKGGNTSNLFSDLKNHHPKKYSELKAGNTELPIRGKEKQVYQPKITDALSSVQKYTQNSKCWKHLTDAVTRGIAKDMMPVYSVEKPGFRQMLTQFDSRYELPSRKYFSQVALPALYAKVHDNVESEVQGIKYYSATTDLWSSKGLLPYISYTIHWLDDEFNYKTRCLETFYLPSDHTATNISDALKDIQHTWKLPEEVSRS